MSEAVEEKVVPEIDQLVPKAQTVTYEFGLDGHLKFVQRPLSFFGKMELFSILGTAVEKALSDGGMSLAELLDDVPTSTEADQLSEADQFIKSIARLVQFAPEFLKDLYVISLGVKRDEREYVKSVMELPEHEGGLSDDQGIQILETFVDQNWDVLVDFFREKILPLISRASSAGPESPSSKPSKATRQRTPKQ